MKKVKNFLVHSFMVIALMAYALFNTAMATPSTSVTTYVEEKVTSKPVEEKIVKKEESLHEITHKEEVKKQTPSIADIQATPSDSEETDTTASDAETSSTAPQTIPSSANQEPTSHLPSCGDECTEESSEPLPNDEKEAEEFFKAFADLANEQEKGADQEEVA